MLAFLLRIFRKQPGSSRDGCRKPSHRNSGSSYWVRIAVYDSLAAVPRVVDLSSGDVAKLLDEIANKAYSLSHEKGGRLPYMVIKEVLENLIHADFREAVISILPDGNTIRVSDQGPGIPNKDRAFLPGFTTATSQMKQYIRGVGSGLPIVRESLLASGGSIVIEDNLKSGCVVTISLPPEGGIPQPAPELDTRQPVKSEKALVAAATHTQGEKLLSEKGTGQAENPISNVSVDYEKLNQVLSQRQKKVFLLIADVGEAGPSTVVKELDISLSTAYRDLVTLEEFGLLASIDNTGKRKLTEKGLAYLSKMFQ
ncbi:MAG TPA: ATP-binding protein [Firmicutes bacterium]|nr:ATP-binding protein [Bacillota bacterium]